MRRVWAFGVCGVLTVFGAAASGASLRGDYPLPTVSLRHKEQVEAREIAGAVVFIANTGRLLHLESVGQSDQESRVEMKEDTLFWIASMTQPVTATALMMLQEEGKLSIEDPVGKYLPELAHLKTEDGREQVVTLRHLLTHTSGMGEATAEEMRASRTLAELVTRSAGKPLRFAPGSRWSDGQSSINTAARVVEVVTGQAFPEFLQQRLFGPLGMKDTTFYPTSEQEGRLAKAYRRSPEGQLESTDLHFLMGRRPGSRDRLPSASAGLFSTAADFGLFLRMFLNGGRLYGKQFLKPESVRQMTTVQTGELDTGFTPGNGWGLGWCVVREPQGVSRTLGPGSYGHGGAYGTQAWIDPVRRLVYVLLMQRADFANSDGSEVRRVFHEAVATDLRKK